MKKVEHIGIAVKNLAESNKLFESLFGESAYKLERVDTEKVSTSFYKVGDTKIELVEATDPDSAIAKFVEKRGEGLHHIAFEVEDIVSEMKRLKDEAKDDKRLIDATHGRRTRSIIVMDSNHVVLSAIQAETISQRYVSIKESP